MNVEGCTRPSGSRAWLARALAVVGALFAVVLARPAHADEASLKLPDLGSHTFAGVGNMDGRSLLFAGMGVCALGLIFGMAIYMQLKALPVHRSMREISELIYETCK